MSLHRMYIFIECLKGCSVAQRQTSMLLNFHGIPPPSAKNTISANIYARLPTEARSKKKLKQRRTILRLSATELSFEWIFFSKRKMHPSKDESRSTNLILPAHPASGRWIERSYRGSEPERKENRTMSILISIPGHGRVPSTPRVGLSFFFPYMLAGTPVVCFQYAC